MIKVQNLSKTYKNFSLQNVSFEFEKEDIIAFVGDNGSGKTTTIKLIFDLTKKNQGEVFFNEQSLYVNSNLLKIAFFPDSNNIPLEISVKQYMKYIAIIARLNKKECNDRMLKILEVLNFEKFKNTKIKNLSAGLKKRAIMAGVLMTKPEFIILDEPTANLDVESKIEFIKIIKELNTSGVGILITSHIIEELQEIANKLIIIKNGKIMYNDKIDNKKTKIIDIYNTFKEKDKSDLKGISDIYD
ncbi:ABC transporter ATP-binding protein [Spiroplasma chinense]|uniref:ABC transporter ATP-binding protein n=1 Tax=Spiroplasma chinense TaxID=216932 RepID=A0A5B9Y6K5_9MOLU|nr:ABC transporter ATP-binding protein [Spiroplasma chinense]QEH61897.1 ABC transporter ATP-binding protein [Spiroplasma chinense]